MLTHLAQRATRTSSNSVCSSLVVILALLLGSSGCESSGATQALGRDAATETTDADICETAHADFQAFLAKHRSCRADTDCTTVGDCGPHIDHEPVRVDAAAEARRLQELTCGTGFDGEFDGVRCERGQCVAVPGGGCCGCLPPDAGTMGIVEAVLESDYYVRFDGSPGEVAILKATSLSGAPNTLLKDQVAAGTEERIFHALEGTGGHTMPSNFFGSFQVAVDGTVVYQGVTNADWKGTVVDGEQRYTLTVGTTAAP